MKTLIEITGWSDDALNKDGVASVGMCENGSDVCLLPFIKNSNLQIRLVDLLPENSYLTFSEELKTIKYGKLSPFSIGCYFNLLSVLLMYVTGNKHLINQNIFDMSLSSFDNPGNKETFPYNRPLLIVGVHTNLMLIKHKPAIVLTDESNGNKWSLSTEVFSHAKLISIS